MNSRGVQVALGYANNFLQWAIIRELKYAAHNFPYVCKFVRLEYGPLLETE